MITAEELVEIGQFNKAHGIGGEMSATVVCDPEDIESFSALIVSMDGIFVPFFVSGIRTKGRSSVLLKMDGVDTEEYARRFVNKKIYALREEFSDEEEVRGDFLIGYSMIDQDGAKIGEITDVDFSTENALFVMERDGRNFYIPITDDFIVEIREDSKILVMDLPQGMIDVQID